MWKISSAGRTGGRSEIHTHTHTRTFFVAPKQIGFELQVLNQSHYFDLG